MDLKEFKRAVVTEDHPVIARGIRELQAAGNDDRAIFRIALAALPDLEFGVWTDLATLSLQRHPEVYGREARVATHPATDAWVQGDRFGNVVSHKNGTVRVKLDSGRTLSFAEDLVRVAY